MSSKSPSLYRSSRLSSLSMPTRFIDEHLPHASQCLFLPFLLSLLGCVAIQIPECRQHRQCQSRPSLCSGVCVHVCVESAKFIRPRAVTPT